MFLFFALISLPLTALKNFFLYFFLNPLYTQSLYSGTENALEHFN